MTNALLKRAADTLNKVTQLAASNYPVHDHVSNARAVLADLRAALAQPPATDDAEKWKSDPAYLQLQAGKAHAEDQPSIADWIERLHARIATLRAERDAMERRAVEALQMLFTSAETGRETLLKLAAAQVEIERLRAALATSSQERALTAETALAAAQVEIKRLRAAMPDPAAQEPGPGER